MGLLWAEGCLFGITWYSLFCWTFRFKHFSSFFLWRALIECGDDVVALFSSLRLEPSAALFLRLIYACVLHRAASILNFILFGRLAGHWGLWEYLGERNELIYGYAKTDVSVKCSRNHSKPRQVLFEKAELRERCCKSWVIFLVLLLFYLQCA